VVAAVVPSQGRDISAAHSDRATAFGSAIRLQKNVTTTVKFYFTGSRQRENGFFGLISCICRSGEVVVLNGFYATAGPETRLMLTECPTTVK
jgi:hypothetical protein